MNIPKYRAYIKATGEMRLVTVLDLWAQTVEAIPLKEKTKTSYLSKMKFYSFDEIELMQYIELKDINGIEIYKEDVIEFSNIKSEYRLKNQGSASPRGKIIYKDCSFVIKTSDSLIFWPYLMECHTYEIIGNIHQHPELLEK